MVRLRDAFVSGLALITFPDRGPSYKRQPIYGLGLKQRVHRSWLASPGPHPLPAGRQSQGDQRCATQIDVL